MKTKYLFGMLVSGAMLAACTADDDFNTAPVAQETNPSAPVFTIHFDGLQNRAQWLEQNNGGHKVGFESGDLLSLFHGVNIETVAGSDPGEGFIGYDNAIYEAAEGKDADGNDTFTLTTKSMVKDGAAVLIYPADTTFANTGSDAPVITVPKKQDEFTKLKTPHMSEVLTIDPYPTEGSEIAPDVNSSQAGYGRKYDVYLKRVGSTLTLSLTQKNPKNFANVEALKIKSVKLKAKSGSGAFTTEIKVKALEAASKAQKPNSAGEATQHFSWNNQSELDLTSVVGADSLSTSDVNNGVATFTLLPYKDATGYAGDATDQIIVYTNYGSVTLKTNDNNKVWKRGSTTESIQAGLKNLLNNKNCLWDAASAGTTFAGENIGYEIQRSLEVDMNGLNMDGLHIENEDHLMDALTVYKNYYSDKTVQFILDGEKEGVNKGKFVMSKEAWTELAAALNKTGSKLTVAPCNIKEEICNTIVLKSGDSEANVPALQFAYAVNENGTTESSYTLTMELDGKWAYVSGTASDKYLKLTGIAELNVVAGSTLTPKGYITAQKANSNIFDINIEKDAFMVIPTGVDATIKDITINNKGQITINAQSFLSAHNDAKLNNCAPEESEDEDNPTTGLSEDGGEILNYGTLSAVKETTGEVHNRGVIRVKNNVAATLITSNRTSPFNVKNKFSATNNAGSIILFQADGNKQTTITSQQGFIKLTINKPNPTKDEVGIANYLILDKGCTAIGTTVKGADGKDTEGIPSTVNYIESHGADVMVSGTYTLNGLIVPEGTFRILLGTVVTMAAENDLYVKGKIVKSGTLSGTLNYSGYFGGADSDSDNVRIN